MKWKGTAGNQGQPWPCSLILSAAWPTLPQPRCPPLCHLPPLMRNPRFQGQWSQAAAPLEIEYSGFRDTGAFFAIAVNFIEVWHTQRRTHIKTDEFWEYEHTYMTHTQIRKPNISSLPKPSWCPQEPATLTSNTSDSFCLWVLYRYEIIRCVLFFIWLLCSTVFVWLIHVVLCGCKLFILTVLRCSIVWIEPNLFVHSTADGCWVISSIGLWQTVLL